jgi:DNA-binding response OmpR family regulator
MNSSDPPAILIVESEALIAMMITDLLSEVGHRTLWAPDAAQAVAAAGGDGAPLAAAVVGLRLNGGTDGRSVLRHLRCRRPGLPAIVVTGFDGRAPEAELRGLGGPTARLAMPFEWRRLTAILADILSRPAGFTQPCRRRRLAA